MKTNRKILWIVALFAVCFAERVGQADPVGPLTTFVAGTPAKASEVNANLSAVKTAVDDNHSRITTLEGVNVAGRLTTLETTVTPAGNIVLVSSTPTTGNILKGATPFIHNSGTLNTFIGVNAGNLAVGTLGGGCCTTAIGEDALTNMQTGEANTAVGSSALHLNSSGGGNTATGQGALFNNTEGAVNTATGSTALASNTTGNENTAFGSGALGNNTTGGNNIAIGSGAGINLTTGSGNIAIGNLGVGAESATTRIGSGQTRAFIAGIRGVTTGVADAVNVVVDSSGQLGTVNSSGRVKDNVSDMGEASGALMQLRPVTFHYKSDKNPKGRTLQYGLVAEEVAKVAPGLVVHSSDGGIETVYYQFLVPMLLNEYQKQQRTIQAQAAELTKQTAKVDKQAMEIAELRQQTTRITELESQAVRMTAVLDRLERSGMIATAGR